MAAPGAYAPAGPLLRLSDAFPPAGPGTFTFANSPGDVLGDSGTVRRFRVGVERGAGEDVDTFAAQVDQALGDRRSWIGSGRLRLQRVPAASGSDFTIYLATGQTARSMCAQGGVDIVVNGEPYTSCRTFGKVIINLSRWRLSVPGYLGSRVPLASYRQYVINHEVGHELGHRHEPCPGRGRTAPVMLQQTLGLRGCTANSWPYPDGRR